MNANYDNCKVIEGLLDAYHDGELSDGERILVEKHLLSCPVCQVALDKITQVVASLKALPRVAPEHDIDVNKLLDRTVPRRLQMTRPMIWATVAVAAAAAILLMVGHFLSVPPLLVAEGSRVVQHNLHNQSVNAPKMIVEQHKSKALPEPTNHKSKIGISGGNQLANKADVVNNSEDVIEERTEADSSSIELPLLAEGDRINMTEAMGLATDKDGLYALKM